MTPDEERLLESLLLGSADPQDAEVREALERSEDLRAAWSEHARIGGWLDEQGQLERSVIADDAAAADAPRVDIEALALDRLGRGSGAAPGRAAGGGRRLAILLAAVLVVALGLWRYTTGVDDRREIPLGEGAAVHLEPADGAAFTGRFAWTSDVPEAGRAFRVLVETDGELFESPAVRELEWVPNADEVRAFGTRFRWWVRTLRGGEVDSDSSPTGATL